jgi:hypothetical protein
VYSRVTLRGRALGAILVITSAACGELLHTGDGPVEPVEDASSLEASPDSTFMCLPGDDAAPADSPFDTSPSREASTDDASDASHASDSTADATADASKIDATRPYCDNACVLGDQECTLLPQVCTYDDAGHTVGCHLQGQGIWTCVLGNTGCTVWANGVACKPDVPCCVTCEQGVCPLGNTGDPCEQNTDCASNACDAVTHACVPHQCADDRQDGDESDVDCGGILCGACLGGKRCRNSLDCYAGHVCNASHVCSGPNPSTVDAAPCADECTVGAQACSQLPQVCTHDDAGFTVSCEAPGEGTWTCVVGSAGCAVWAPGPACGSSVACCAGCAQVACDAGLCWSCPPGSVGKPCEQDTDCVSGACDPLGHACVSSQCADHRQDGLETDVDCGGPVCNGCVSGQGCQSNRDCAAGHVCVNNGYGSNCT